MAFSVVLLGTGPDTTGSETLYSGFSKVNTNFTTLAGVNGATNIGITAGTFTGVTIQAALLELWSKTDQITYENLYTNGDVGNGTDQVSPGIHTHGEFDAEITADGTLVYPYHTTQTYSYDTDDFLDSIETTYNSVTYTMTFTYNSSDVLESLTVNTSDLDSWTKTLTYNSSGFVTDESPWT